jgi:hypothetical protein
MLKKIWTDPVWSKVISVGIIGVISLIYALIKSHTDDITVRQVYEGLLLLKVKVIYVIGVIVLFYVVKRLTRKKSESYYNTKQQKLRTFNKLTDPNSGIMFRWGVYFDYDKPFISDLEAFCTKHEGAPMRFVRSYCPVNGCQNSRQGIDFNLVKNHIESILINEWDKFNKN